MFSILYAVIISPIELVVEVVFELLFRMVGQRQTNQGIAVIGVSVAISLLTLPLYRRADAVQQRERDMQKRLSHWAAHIRRTFKGDERFMMLQAYYRENGYSPLMALGGSVSLLLEIPFFIAAYHFLSHLAALTGAAFGPIADLGAPDGLLRLGGVTLNLLPLLMTAINCASAAVYLRGFPAKDKAQAYGMALVFLVLLYRSPAGLVVYWTCNNVFSLVKNIFYRFRNPRRVFDVCCAAVGAAVTLVFLRRGMLASFNRRLFQAAFVLLACLPLGLSVTQGRTGTARAAREDADVNGSLPLFLLGGLFITVLLGVLIPSAVIAASPAEFVDLGDYRNPLYFLVHSSCYAAGFFLFWAGIIYAMLPQKGRRVLAGLLWVCSGVFLVSYMCFGRDLGVLSSMLVFDTAPVFSRAAQVENLGVIVLVCAALALAYRMRRLLPFAYLVLVICAGTLSIVNVSRAQRQLADMAYVKDAQEHRPVPQNALFSLSRKGRNVIVFMLDRAISGYVPYLFEEKPELRAQFAGFTYYPNALSHGFFTNFGTPALFGGYEYTVTEMNRRDTERLADKHDEALKVMPRIFSERGFAATVCDPPYAGYKWEPDVSIYKDYPGIRAYVTMGVIQDGEVRRRLSPAGLRANERTFFCYSVFKAVPLCMARIVYDNGNYYSSSNRPAEGFVRAYSVLARLPQLTGISDGEEDTFLMMANDTTHEPCLLQLPDYVPEPSVDNAGHATAADGRIGMDTEGQIIHYHANMAAFLQMGRWFDFMRESGVWDNTRIILVSDHGRGLAQFGPMLMADPEIDVEWCNPLLMVKDFGSTEFSVSHEFMTNADVPTLAMRGVVQEPVNPFTGKAVTDAEKSAHPQLVTSSHHWDVGKNNGATFDTSDGHWFSVHDDIFKEENWEQLD